MTPALHKIWCDEDKHYEYEHFADFNEWLDSEEGQAWASPFLIASIKYIRGIFAACARTPGIILISQSISSFLSE